MGFFRAPSPYQGNNSGRGPSGALWFDLPDDITDPNIGIIDGDDFVTCPYVDSTSAVAGTWGRYAMYSYAGGSIVDAGIAGGGITLASDGDNEGVALQSLTGAYKIAATTKKLWFETRIATSTISDTKHNLFSGLLEPLTPTTAVPLTTGDILADKNVIGFARLIGAPTALAFTYKNSGQTVQAPIAAAATLAAATYVKVGFKYDPNALATRQLQVFVNGVPNATAVTATNIAAVTFPNDTFLGFAMAMMNATASSPGSFSSDWWQCAQLI